MSCGRFHCGEVERRAASVDVALDEPGHRRDVRVPAPLRLVAVAVEAGALRECPCARRVPVRLHHDRGVRVAAAIRDGLDQREQRERPDAPPEERSARASRPESPHRPSLKQSRVFAIGGSAMPAAASYRPPRRSGSGVFQSWSPACEALPALCPRVRRPCQTRRTDSLAHLGLKGTPEHSRSRAWCRRRCRCGVLSPAARAGR